MKQKIHPEYFDTKVSCACGHTFTTGSTVPEIRVELCSNCHPFYTGKQKFVDSARRVEKFVEKKARTTAAAVTRKGKTVKRAVRAAKKKAEAEAEE
ncbi:MAG: rpmE [Candidatus Magasanikbacteria bacterium]|nr:rpmE [Candidatus Magasanikbacteria bacterium]